ncbi:hypothetical protein [Spirochaeta dissipatitropha]
MFGIVIALKIGFIPILIISIIMIYLTARRTYRPGKLESRVYRLAAEHNGRLTVSLAVIGLDISAAEAEYLLQSLVDNQRVRMEVENSGQVVYEFLELSR